LTAHRAHLQPVLRVQVRRSPVGLVRRPVPMARFQRAFPVGRGLRLGLAAGLLVFLAVRARPFRFHNG